MLASLLVPANGGGVTIFDRDTPTIKIDKPPRQIISDMKWEGDTWISSEDLYRASTFKRRKLASDEEEDVDEDNTRPPRPPEPEEDRDDMHRSKDKDYVPSRMTWNWDEEVKEWVLIERPRMPVAGMFFSYAPIPAKQISLLKTLISSEGNVLSQDFLRTELVPRLNRTHRVSLRSLDWLVVDYALEMNVHYNYYVPALKRDMIVVVHSLYSSLRERWKRRRFDGFRRRHRIYFDLDGGTYSTTVAQLNFFYIAHMYGFLDYASQHLDAIESHMKFALQRTADAKEEARRMNIKYKRKPLVKKAQARVFASKVPSDLSFKL